MQFRNFVLKFLVKVFVSLYLLTMLIDRVDTLHVGRYWSEVLCSTITDRNFVLNFLVKV